MKNKINEIASKLATAISVALIGWTAFAGLVVQKAQKQQLWNDDEIVTNATADFSAEFAAGTNYTDCVGARTLAEANTHTDAATNGLLRTETDPTVPAWAKQQTPPVMQETDPTVPTWAKQPNPPTNGVTVAYVDAGDARTLEDANAHTDAATNGLLRTETDPTVPAWAKQQTPPVMQETDPTVPAWAKQPNPPTNGVTVAYVDAGDARTFEEANARIDAATNGLLRTETDPTVPTWAKQPNPPKMPEKFAMANLTNANGIGFVDLKDSEKDGVRKVRVVQGVKVNGVLISPDGNNFVEIAASAPTNGATVAYVDAGDARTLEEANAHTDAATNGLLRTETDPTVPAWAKQPNPPTNGVTVAYVDAGDARTLEEANAHADAAIIAATGSIRKVDGAARYLPKYLWCYDCADSYPEDAAYYYSSRGGGDPSACSSVRYGNTYSRNFDFPFDDRAEFVVRMSALPLTTTTTTRRYASVGMAQVGTNLTEEIVTSGKPSRWYKCLPGSTVDGINENGVVCNINVVDGDPQTSGWLTGGDIHPLGAVRWALDNGETAEDVATNLACRIKFPSGWTQNYHYMIADEFRTFIIENGAAHEVTNTPAVMTNFRLYPTPAYGAGWERYMLLQDSFASITNAWYTRAYSSDSEWISEFGSEMLMETAKVLWASKSREAHRGETYRPTTTTYTWWQSIHTSVYDISNRVLRVAVQEQDDWYTFQVPASGNGGGVDEGKVREIVQPMIEANERVGENDQIVRGFVTDDRWWDIRVDIAYSAFHADDADIAGYASEAASDYEGNNIVDTYARKDEISDLAQAATNYTDAAVTQRRDKLDNVCYATEGLTVFSDWVAVNPPAGYTFTKWKARLEEEREEEEWGEYFAVWGWIDDRWDGTGDYWEYHWEAYVETRNPTELAFADSWIGVFGFDATLSRTVIPVCVSNETFVTPTFVTNVVADKITSATNGVAYQVTTEPIPASLANKVSYIHSVTHEGETHDEDEDGSVVIGKGAVGTVNKEYIASLTNATKKTELRSMAVAIGMNARAQSVTGDKAQAIAIGANSKAIGPNAIAIGSGAKHWYETDETSSAAVATGSQAIAIGYTAKAYGINAMQLGKGVNNEPNSLKYLDTTIVKDGKVQATIDHFAVTAMTNANGTAMKDFKDLPVDYVVGGKTWEKTALTSSGIYGMTYGDGLFVGCGYSASDTGMWYSTNGINWYRGDKTDGGFEAVCYGDGMFVASSSTDAGLWYSTNGINWAQGSATTGDWSGIAYGDGRWVAAGRNANGLWYSTNGLDWTQSAKTDKNWRGVGYARGRFVAGSSDGSVGIWYSDDGGETWKRSSEKSYKAYAFAYGNGRFVAGAGDNVHEAIWSEDGKTWNHSTNSSIRVFGMVYASGRFIAACYTGGIWYSDDGGETWVESDPVGVNGYWYGLAYGNGRVLASSISGGARGVWYSDDRIVRDVPLVQQIKVNGSFVEADSNNVASITETDPTVPAWAKQPNPPKMPEKFAMANLTNANGYGFVDLKNPYSKRVQHPAGEIWKPFDVGNKCFKNVVEGWNGHLVALSSDGTAWYSDNNGTTWLQGSGMTAIPNTSAALCFGVGCYLCAGCVEAGGIANAIFRSEDGVSWEQVGVFSMGPITGITYGPYYQFDRFYMCTASILLGSLWGGDIFYSDDYGKTWHAEYDSPASKKSWGSICWGNGYYAIGHRTEYATNDDGLQYSPSGALPWNKAMNAGQWTVTCNGYDYFLAGSLGNAGIYYGATPTPNSLKRSSITTGSWPALACGQSRFVAGNAEGGIYYSADHGATWNLCKNTNGKKLLFVSFAGGKFYGCIDGAQYISEDESELTKEVPVVQQVSVNGQMIENDKDNIAKIEIHLDDLTRTNGVKIVDLHEETVHYSSRINFKPSHTNNVAVQGVAYGNGRFVAVSDSGEYYSDDGEEWEKSSGIPYPSKCVCCGNGRFVAGTAYYGLLLDHPGFGLWYSDDEGKTWLQSGKQDGHFSAITYGNGRFIASDGHTVDEYSGGVFHYLPSYIWTSTDGISWTKIPEVSRQDQYSVFESVTYGNGLFIGFSIEGYIYSSANGTTWHKTTEYEGIKWSCITYGNGMFIAGTDNVGQQGQGIWYSYNGIKWYQSKKTDGLWGDLAYGSGRFIAGSTLAGISREGDIWTSVDGINWTQVRTDTWSWTNDPIWGAVAYGNGKFVIGDRSSEPHGFWYSYGDSKTSIPVVQSISINGEPIAPDGRNNVNICVDEDGAMLRLKTSVENLTPTSSVAEVIEALKSILD